MAAAAVSVAVTLLFYYACWRPGSLPCSGVYPQPLGLPDDPLDATTTPASLEILENPPEQHPDGVNGVGGDLWAVLGIELLAGKGRASLAAAQDALRGVFSACSGPACMQSLEQAVHRLLLRP